MQQFIISGASKGTGRELAKTLASQGHKVMALARNQGLLESLRNEVDGKNRDNLRIYPIDLIDALNLDKLFRDLKKSSFDKSLTLIHCAATWTGGKPVKEIILQDFKNSMELNFFSGYNVISSFINHFKYTPELPNNIVVLGATASLRGSANCSAFAAPKGALRLLCQSLAREEGKNGLHVSHVILDGLIGNKRTKELNPDREDDKYMKMKSIVDAIMYLINQKRDAWTHELDIRPNNEKF